MAKDYKINRSFTFDGKRYFIHADTEEEFYTKKANKIRDLEDGRVVLSGNTTVEVWANEAIETYKPNLSDKGLTDMRYRIDKHILPSIGRLPVKSVRPVQCQKLLNELSGMSSSLIDKVYQDLGFLFRTAKTNHLVLEDPTTDLVRPVGTSGERRSITEHEREHFLSVCEKLPGKFTLFELIYYCGCRPSEAIGCMGKDIETLDGAPMLHIRGTKTSNSDRKVPIPLCFYPKVKNTPKFAPLATTEANTAFSETMYNRLVSRLRREMNISMGCRLYRNQLVPPFPLADDFVPYCLRHTYCTDLARKGVDIRTAQKLMGHANIQITANIYTHVDDSQILRAAELINQAI